MGNSRSRYVLLAILGFGPCVCSMAAAELPVKPLVLNLETVNIVAGHYRGVLESPKSGVLAEIHQLIAAETGLPTSLEISPVRRARHTFFSGDAHGIFSVFNAVERPMDVIYSVPFARLSRYLFTRHGQPVLQKLSDLKGLRLGLVQGYIYNQLDMDLLAAQGTTIHWAIDQGANLRMLSAGRIDVLVATPYECVMLAKASQLPRPEYDIGSPITHYEFVYAFHSTAQGIALEETFSASIRRLEARNKLQPLSSQFQATMDQSD